MEGGDGGQHPRPGRDDDRGRCRVLSAPCWGLLLCPSVGLLVFAPAAPADWSQAQGLVERHPQGRELDCPSRRARPILVRGGPAVPPTTPSTNHLHQFQTLTSTDINGAGHWHVLRHPHPGYKPHRLVNLATALGAAAAKCAGQGPRWSSRRSLVTGVSSNTGWRIRLGHKVLYRGVLVRLEVRSGGRGDADISLEDGTGLRSRDLRMA